MMRTRLSQAMFWFGSLLIALFPPLLLKELSSQLAWIGVVAALSAYAFAWLLKFNWKLSQVPKQSEWLSLGEALEYLAYQTRWARSVGSAINESEFDRKVAGEFRERLARGEIRSRGKPADADDLGMLATRPICPGYWATSWFQPGAEIYQADVNRGAVTRGKGAGDSLRAVLVHRQDLTKVWPRASFARFRPRPELTDCIEPLRHMFAVGRAA